MRAFVVRHMFMADTHRASIKAAARRTVPEMAALSPGMNEELAALRAIVEASTRGGGEEYFQALIRTLVRVVDTRWAFIAQFSSPEIQTKARTIAFWDRDHIAENFEWTL